MPILDHWDLPISTDIVLRAQGIDPDIISTLRPKLITNTENAIRTGAYLIKPKVVYQKFKVNRLVHNRLELAHHNSANKSSNLTGNLITQHLAKAQEVIALISTLGRELDETISSLLKADPVAALALDGVGSAAVELLAIQASNYFERQAKSVGLSTSIPLNPGMIGWPFEVGQVEIFSLVDSEEIQVSLTESLFMVPNKSLSMVIGVGKEIAYSGSTCDFCSLKDKCKYQNHYGYK